jgi:hypothetical protein
MAATPTTWTATATAWGARARSIEGGISVTASFRKGVLCGVLGMLIAGSVGFAAFAGSASDPDLTPQEVVRVVTVGPLRGVLKPYDQSPWSVKYGGCHADPAHRVWRVCRLTVSGTSTCQVIVNIRRIGRAHHGYHGWAKRMRCRS